MKYHIENSLKYYPSIFPTVASVLEHLFCVNGNGVDLDNRGFLCGNYRTGEAYEFGEPVPLKSIYPWSEDERFQPFRKYAGCRDVGFKEAVEHFLQCLDITPDSVSGIDKWKQAIPVMRSVLLDAPLIKDVVSSPDDMRAFIDHIWDDVCTDGDQSKSPPNSVRKEWYFDVQWSDCPRKVEMEVRQMWRDYGLGNDDYIRKVNLDNNLFEGYPLIYMWLKLKGVKEGELVIIHWWW